jgi:hypothetical protein
MSSNTFVATVVAQDTQDTTVGVPQVSEVVAEVVVAVAKKKRVVTKKQDQVVESGAVEAGSVKSSGKPIGKKEKKADKAEKVEKAISQVVEMVNEMKSAFTSPTPCKPCGPEPVAAADADADVVDAVEPEELLTVEFYEEEDVQDSMLDVEELRLDGDETPCHVRDSESDPVFNPIPDVIAEPMVQVTQAVSAAMGSRTVFRHEFSDECFKLLKQFSVQNMHLSRKDYKRSWEAFATQHAEFMSQEAARLADSGYTGDVLVKMFKTARYYLTKKEKRAANGAKSGNGNVDDAVADAVADAVVAEVDDDDATVSEEGEGEQVVGSGSDKGKGKRRPYIPLDKAILQEMDAHIRGSILTNAKPSTCYSSFCEQVCGAFQREVARLVCLEGRRDDNNSAAPFTQKSAEDKLKKTYKNRMFLLLREASSSATAAV